MTHDVEFAELKEIASLAGDDPEEARSRLYFLLDEGRADTREPIVNSLLCRLGMYPYVNADELSLGERLAYEAHRADEAGDSIVMHADQGRVFGLLMDGENVALSAPTSFGKSLLIDAVIGASNHNHVAIIIPTIALLDETRRRLNKFRPKYQIITTGLQRRVQDHAIYVLTPERALERNDLNDINFFVIDEFYKISQPGDAARQLTLSRVFERLRRTNAQYYMLGPNIQGLADGAATTFDIRFIKSTFNTVASRRRSFAVSEEDRLEFLKDLVGDIGTPALIYCRSPASAGKVARGLCDALPVVQEPGNLVDSAIAWLGENVHPEWNLVESLRHGIGIHHGAMQRSISQAMVRMFNEGHLKYLVCTSTIIEGVNTAARTVVVFDHKVGKQKIDFFTFNNIIGRSGRMFEHFVGESIVFEEPPDPNLPIVDIPSADPAEDDDLDLLLEIDPERLSAEIQARIDNFEQGDHGLDREALRANPWLRADEQVRLANWMRAHPRETHQTMMFRYRPSYNQQMAIFDAVWNKAIEKPTVQIRGIFSSKQLAFIVHQADKANSVTELVNAIVEKDQSVETISEAVEKALGQLRNIVGYHGPRLLHGFAAVAAMVYPKLTGPSKMLHAHASRIEHWNLPPEIAALDEYGLPFQMANRFVNEILVGGDLDATLEKLHQSAPHWEGLTPFETFMLQEFLSN